MGYNISEVTGAAGGLDTWTFDVTLNGTSTTTVSGDFDEVPIGGGTSGEADLGYDFTVTSGGEYGSLVFDAVTGEFTFMIDRAAVFLSGSDQTVVISISGTDSQGSDTDTLFINLLICVARGTLIDTPSGPVAVECLEAGDQVLTVDGPPQPIRWIGCRRVSGRELRADASLRPVRIKAGAFGANGPDRDLMVSPQHRILLGGWKAELMFGEVEVLVPAKGLVNDRTIRVVDEIRDIDYFHVLFDRHEIMFTEGLPTESFHPGDHALREIDSDARAEVLALFPELSDRHSLPRTARTALRPWEGRLLQDRAATAGNLERWELAT